MARLKTEQIAPVFDELIARVDEAKVMQDQQEATSGLSRSEIEALVHKEANMSRAFEDETMIVQASQEGSVVTNEVKLGDTMRAFEHLLTQRREEMAALLEDLHQIDNEIAAATEDIRTTEIAAKKDGRRSLEEAFAEFAKEALEAKQNTLTDIKQARKEDQVAKRKIESLVKCLMEEDEGDR